MASAVHLRPTVRPSRSRDNSDSARPYVSVDCDNKCPRPRIPGHTLNREGNWSLASDTDASGGSFFSSLGAGRDFLLNVFCLLRNLSSV